MLFKFFTYTLFLPLFLTRWLLWLAIFQQKEYRLDRLRVYLKTSQGKNDLVKIIPAYSDLSRKKLKRPKLTWRIIVTASLSAGMIVGLLKLISSGTIFQLSLILVLVIVAMPLIIYLVSLPLQVGKYFITLFIMWLASWKIKQASPIIVGITGSYGKTSTKHLLPHLLSTQTTVFASQRSFNTPVSLALDILRRYKNEKITVFEYAAYKPGEIKKLANIFKPHLAVITGFTTQHLATFGSQERIVQAKAELILALPAKGTVFFNQADEGVGAIVDYAMSRSVVELQLQPFNSTQDNTQLQLDNKGRLKLQIDKHSVQSQLIGKQYRSIIFGAAAVAQHFKIPSKQIVASIESFMPDDSYVRFFRHKQGFWVIDDGRTCNPAGFKAAIELTQQLLEKRQLTGKCILFTSGIIDLGEVSRSTHQQLAKEARQIFSQVVYLGEPGQDEFKAAFGDKLINTEESAKGILPLLSVNDLILVEGRLPIWLAKSLEIKQ